jgi:hypothetical protein
MSSPLQISDLPLAEQVFIGLDIGGQRDFTAGVITMYHPRYLIDRELASLGEGDELLFPEYQVRVLPRWPLGTTMTAVAQQIRRMTLSPGLRDKQVSLAIDTTGPGEGARDIFERAGLFGLHVIITGGYAESKKYGRDYRLRYHVSKDLLLSPLKAMSEPDNKRLHIIDTTEEARTLIRELKNFDPSSSMRQSKTEDDIVWREQEHDDLVLACALSIWLSKGIPQGDVDESLVGDGPRGMFEPLSDDELFKPLDSFF